jgi:cation:H+ antiporter
MLSIGLLLLGALLLYLGGEALVRNSVHLARGWGVGPLVIGLTVVAFGTSSPELAATLIAAARGETALALANVIGSNTANLGLILGLTALLQPISARARFIRREVPIMIGVSLLLAVLVSDAALGRLEGLLLLGLLVPYLSVLLRGDEASRVEKEFVAEYGDAPHPLWYSLTGAALGVALLVVGAHALIEGALRLARGLGISERVIGLTLVAIGTSLPELATALVAALRRESDIVLGNLIGSNVFNILGILGSVALLHPMQHPMQGIWIDLGVMIGFSLAVLPFLATGQRLGRIEGALLLASYLLYVGILYR